MDRPIAPSGERTRTRLTDIATLAQVSEATVSRVLNGKRGVAESTREAVLTAIALLGYEPPSRLQPKSAGLVGLVIPELTNPIFPAFAQVIETSLARHAFTPVLCTHTPFSVTEDDYVQMLLDRGVAGIIFISGKHADTTTEMHRYFQLKERGLPIVLINGFVEQLDVPFVSTDEHAAMDMAVRHLAHLGHRDIGLVNGPERYIPSIRKVAGFQEVMRSALGRDPESLEDVVVHAPYTAEGGASAATRLLERGVSAVVCASDLMALGAIRAVRSVGMRVPEDVSVIGYDDSHLMGFTDPPMTTVRQSVLAMGEAAVSALLDDVRGTTPHHGELLFRPELVVRGTTGACHDR